MTKFVRKVAQSKVVRFVATATAAYFTAGAALGAMGAASAGTSIVSGAASGLGSAWGGVTGMLSGGGLSSLGAGLTQASAAGASGVGFSSAAATISSGQTIGMTASVGGAGGAAPAAAAAPSATSAAAAAPTQIAGNASSYLLNPATGQPLVQAAAGEAGGKGIVGKAMDFIGTTGGGMVASSALKLAGGAMADRAEEKQRDEELARMNANQNVAGLNVRYGPQATPAAITPGPVTVPEFDPNRFRNGLVGANVAPIG